MVLATRVGRPRRFAVGLLLTIVTFGIYAVYWNYKAHNELYRQFELAREKRDEGMVWYVLGLVLPPFLVAYLWVFGSNVRYLRERVGLRVGMTPGGLVTLVGSAVAAFAIGLILIEAAVVAAGPEPTREELDAAVGKAGLPFLALAAVAAILFAIAYKMLQRDINELWTAYDARMAYLAANPPQAPALRAEIDALRLRAPGLRALVELEALAARVEAGDASARVEADRLVADVATALAEREELMRARDAQIAAYEDASETEDRLAVLEQALFDRA